MGGRDAPSGVRDALLSLLSGWHPIFRGAVEATPEAYREHGRFTPPNPPQQRANPEEKAWAYPVIADGRLYIRDADCLWCYDIKATAAGN